MGVTHHQQLAISGTAQFSGPVIMTGAGKSQSLTQLVVTGTARVSGIFSASAAGKQSSLTKLNVSGTVLNAGLTRVSGNFSASAAAKTADIVHLRVSATGRVSGNFSASAAAKSATITHLKVTATGRVSGIFSASAAGMQSTLTKLNVTGTVALSGNTTLVTPVIASAANAAAGKRYIATAATTAFSIATTKVKTTSRIFLTAAAASAAHISRDHTNLTVNTIASGASFSIRSSYGITPTGATGTVNWLIVNVI